MNRKVHTNLFDISRAWKVRSSGEPRGSSDDEIATILVIRWLRSSAKFVLPRIISSTEIFPLATSEKVSAPKPLVQVEVLKLVTNETRVLGLEVCHWRERRRRLVVARSLKVLLFAQSV